MFLTLKPPLGVRLNTGHPLADGLVGCWIMNEGGGNKVHDLSGNGATGIITQLTWDGLTLTNNSPGSPMVTMPSGYDPLYGTTSFSIVCRIKVFSITSDRGIFYTDVHSSADSLLFYFDAAATDHIIAYLKTTTGGGTAYTSAWVPTLNVWNDIVLTWDGAFVRLYINGVEDTDGSFPAALSGSLIATDTQYCWGNDNDANKDLYGSLDFGSIYNRALTPSEIQSLHTNPYQMFEPEVLWKYVAYGAAAGGLSIPIAMHHYTKNIRSG